MTIAALIEQARLAGLRVYLKEGQVKLAGNKEAGREPDLALIDLLRKNKQAIFRHLTGRGGTEAKAIGTWARLKARRQWEADPGVKQVLRVLGGKLASFTGTPGDESTNQEVLFGR